jgi:hypothetical protein
MSPWLVWSLTWGVVLMDLPGVGVEEAAIEGAPAQSAREARHARLKVRNEENMCRTII